MPIGCGSYPRGQYLQATLSALADHCAATGTHLVLGGEQFSLDIVASKGRAIVLEPLDASDYAHIGRAVLGETRASAIDRSQLSGIANCPLVRT